MFNGYNETPLISYNEFSQERDEKKQENVPKWSYGHDAGAQPVQPHPTNRHSEFWSGKPNFIGIPNVLKCSCTGCYPTSENQSYQGDATRHRPWLPRTFSVPQNGSNEPCKLPTYQWDNGLSNQTCYTEGSLPHVQDGRGKYSYYRYYQNSRLPEPNQPGVITSVKNGDYAKPKNEMPSPIQNGGRQPVLCNPAYNLSKRVDGRNYCDPNEKYSNVASYSVDQQAPRLPVVEPFIKTVPSNLSQNRVPSTGYQKVKENMPQQYINSGYGDARKMSDPAVNGDKKCEGFPTAQLQAGLHIDYSYLNRDLPEAEPQKLFFDNTRHPGYYSKNNFQDVLKRNSQAMDGRKDCAVNQIGITEHHYNMSRCKYQEANLKPSYEMFYQKDFEKSRQENHAMEEPPCFQRNEDGKSENVRFPRPALLFNDPHFPDRMQNSLPYQSNQAAYGSYLRSEYQGYNPQPRYKYPTGFQNQHRALGQQMPSCEQLAPQQGGGFVYDCQQTVDKTEEFYGVKNQPSVQSDSQTLENRKPTYLEAIRSEEINKNGTSKISPLRLLRKKKFVTVPQETTPISSFDAAPGLDVRKFWSTWAEEEEENVASTQMVVLDCQNIDPEQAKLLHLYEADPVRAVQLESIVIKSPPCMKEAVTIDEIKAVEQPTAELEEACVSQEAEREKAVESNSVPVSESEKKEEPKMSPSRAFKKEKVEQERKNKAEILDKWTEKKFDFLKRAEESKAAEILRHEEEKKKIMETRLSLQQSLKKVEKVHAAVEDSVHEKIVPFDENSQTDSPEDGNAPLPDLPTSEYRRNKFLDYSETKVLGNGRDEVGAKNADETTETDEVKKELVKRVDKHPVEKSSPSFKTRLKEEPEMDQILKKISEINFQNGEIKNVLENDSVKKPKGLPGIKFKKKKSDHQAENEDKLKVETVTKPTIKFSIQKSHDLKISFKVLNSSNEYSDKETGGRDAEDNGNSNEDSKNSTELITLRYKSIQRDGDRNSESKKSRRAFRRKKQKTPGGKLKKNRHAAGEERDPLADDSDPVSVPGKPYSDEYATSDDFQVRETVDSAKIKLTFKRHKGNFETEYKINSNNADKFSEVDPLSEECDGYLDAKKTRYRKKSRTRKSEIFAEPGVEAFKNYQQTTADSDSDTEIQQVFLESTVEDCKNYKNSSTSQDSYNEKENSEFPSEPQFAGPTPENVAFGEGEESYAIEDSKTNEETNKCRHEFTENQFINCDNGSEGERHELSLSDCNVFPDVRGSSATAEAGSAKEKTAEFDKEEIQEISLDFIKSTKSQEIETNHKSRKTEETESGAEADKWNECGLEKPEKSRDTSQSEDGDENEKTFELGVSKVFKNWETDAEGSGDVDQQNDCSFDDNVNSRQESELSPAVSFEKNGNEDATPHEQEGVHSEEATLLLFSEKSLEKDLDCENDDAHQTEPEDEAPNLGLTDADTVGNLNDDSKCRNPSEINLLPPEPFKELLVDDKKAETQDAEQSGLEEKDCSADIDQLIENPPKTFIASTESCSFENESSCSQKSPKNDSMELSGLSPTDKIGFESPEIRFEDDGAKGGDNIANGISLDPKDFEQSDSGADEKIEELSKVEAATKSPTDCDFLEPSEALLGDDSDCVEGSFSPDRTTEDKLAVSLDVVCSDSASRPDLELEDGEIVDSSDEMTECFHDKMQNAIKKVDFIVRMVERRHSTDSEKQSGTRETWSRRKFSKRKSCPPELKYPGQVVKMNIPIEDIPLPMGPPPLNSCLDFKKYYNEEAKKEQKESISTEKQFPLPKTGQPSCQSPFGLNDLQNCRNPSPPVFDKEPSSHLGIFQRTSKIKFSFSKRSKFSKIGLNAEKDAFNKEVGGEPEKREVEGPDFEKSKKIRTPDRKFEGSPSKECLTEDVPNIAGEEGGEVAEEDKPRSDSEQPVELCAELGENVEVMNDFIREEFYECEDLPTSEDLANGDDLELEKVNDDKFRNIMQNCIDNAKKFLNIGNLKLFCSVDDLLELDCRTAENEPEKETTNHISRDVLLTSCDDANEDLGLSENVQPADLSMDFVPSFSSDVCPEILPVDNWPYLEEEVPSSPTTSKENETDFIPPLENASALPPEIYPECKLTSSLGSFRRRSIVSDEGTFKLCSKINARRRNTIDCFTSFGKDFCDIKKEIMRLKRQPEEIEKSLKCRLGLKKLSNKHDPDCRPKNGRVRKFSEELAKTKSADTVDYKSPSWQPKVMLFRISKRELRKIMKSSKRFRSKPSGDSPPTAEEPCSEAELKKRKTDFDSGKSNVNTEEEIKKIAQTLDAGSHETILDLPRLSSSFIKGSLSTTDPSRRKKKSRFRNLHTKRKSESDKKDMNRDRNVSQKEAKMMSDGAERLLTEMFKDCDRISHLQPKHLKECKEEEEKSKKKPNDMKPENATEKRLGKDPEATRCKIRDEPNENRHREKKHDHRDRRREREQHRQREKSGESDRRHSRQASDRSRQPEKRPSTGNRHAKSELERKDVERCKSSKMEEKATKMAKEVLPEATWTCEVCGFGDASERVVHIKSHPFHCQSCHLAFKTEVHFIDHLTKKHKDIRNQHHCLLCELSFDTEEQYQRHLDTREHRHLEAVEKNTINTLFTLLTGAPCPVLGIVDMKPEWLPNQAGTVHFYHQATPLSLALQFTAKAFLTVSYLQILHWCSGVTLANKFLKPSGNYLVLRIGEDSARQQTNTLWELIYATERSSRYEWEYDGAKKIRLSYWNSLSLCYYMVSCITCRCPEFAVASSLPALEKKGKLTQLLSGSGRIELPATEMLENFFLST